MQIALLNLNTFVNIFLWFNAVRSNCSNLVQYTNTEYTRYHCQLPQIVLDISETSVIIHYDIHRVFYANLIFAWVLLCNECFLQTIFPFYSKSVQNITKDIYTFIHIYYIN